ncbi:MAG TPA: 2-dehydropantoate 2-reductase, partial [Anaerolineae bacterium]|nr:2-dehydropantoate 2-reductase [Anaerolineae bacterium]
VKVIVIGAGAIGGYLGGKLADHHDVTLVGRAPLVAAINAHGLKIIEPKSERWVRTVHAVDRIEAAFQYVERFDLALFTVKNYDTAAAIEQLQPFGDRIDCILSLQNGIDSEESLAHTFGRGKVIAGTILNPISIPEVGTIRLEKYKGGIGLAALDHQSLESIAALLKDTQLPITLYADYQSMKWSKLLLNLIGNATSAILDMTTRETFNNRNVFRVEVAALREATMVMRAKSIKPVTLPGYPVPVLVFALRFLPITLLQIIMRPLAASGRGDKPPSLLMDLRSGKIKSEINDLNGAISRAGRSIGVNTPVNDFLTSTVQGIAAGRINRSLWRGQTVKLEQEIFK